MKKTTLVLTALLTTTVAFANPTSTPTQSIDFGAIKSFLANQMSNFNLKPTEIASADSMDSATPELEIDFQGMKDFLNKHLNQK